jgi:hypothetical protein
MNATQFSAEYGARLFFYRLFRENTHHKQHEIATSDIMQWPNRRSDGPSRTAIDAQKMREWKTLVQLTLDCLVVLFS